MDDDTTAGALIEQVMSAALAACGASAAALKTSRVQYSVSPGLQQSNIAAEPSRFCRVAYHASTLRVQVRQHRTIAAEQRLRLIHGGTELAGEQPLPPRPCVVHCTLTSVPRPERAPPPVDWVWGGILSAVVDSNAVPEMCV